MSITQLDTKEFKLFLLRQIGNHRRCQHCNEAFIPNDSTSNEALELYTKLYNLNLKSFLDQFKKANNYFVIGKVSGDKETLTEAIKLGYVKDTSLRTLEPSESYNESWLLLTKGRLFLKSLNEKRT